jgi:flagellar motor switch protein FliG
MSGTRIEQAAILLLALGEDAARQLLPCFTPDEIVRLAQTMAALGPVTCERLESTLRAYQGDASRLTGLELQAAPFLARTLSAVLGEAHARQVLARGGLHPEASLDALAWRAPEEIAAWLGDESPLACAVLLAQLPRARAAAILVLLPENRRAEIMTELADWQGAPPEVLLELGKWLAHKQAPATATGTQIAGELLAQLPPGIARALLEQLHQTTPAAALSLRGQLLDLDDLARLDETSRQRFFKQVPARTLLLALKGTRPSSVAGLLARMSETAAQRLKTDLDSLGAVRVDEIEQARASVVLSLREMAMQGQLEMT